MRDPHLVLSNPVVETIRIAPNAKASEFGCPIDHWRRVWKKPQEVHGPLERFLELPRRLGISGMQISKNRFNVGTRPWRVPNLH